MDFGLTDEQRAFKDGVVAFAQAELNDDVIGRDVRRELSLEAWKKCAEFGIQGLPVPKEYGGGDADALTIMLAMEALGYGCRDNGLIFSLNAQMWSAQVPIMRFGNEDQKRRYLPGLCDGSLIGVQGMTEPGSGSDVFGLSTTAEKKGDSYILNGSKIFITNAPLADVFVVFAVTDPTKRLGGFSAFLVERDTPGLEVAKPSRKMGLHTSPSSRLFFTDCEVSEECLLGTPGGGMTIFNTTMDWERSFILASAVGTMQRQIERCVAYARERKQFGQAIGKFQAVAHRIVDMKVRLETSRLLLYQLGWLRTQRRMVPLESAMAKLYVAESFLQSSLDALQIHGGYGYLEENEIEREVRDSVASRIYSGTSEVQRNIVAGMLGL